MRVAVIENSVVTHLGQVGVALHEAGALIDQIRPFVGQPLPSDTHGYDALIVMGGEQSAIDDAAHPYLPHLAALMRRFSDEGRAVLGICLGAQILARGFGAANHLGTAPEFGWTTVFRLPPAADDPMLGSLPDRFTSFQWHSDTFALPPGAVALATSDGAAQQAFRLGRATWGTQFHFEANRAVVADWSRTFADRTEALEPGWIAAMPARSDTLGREADAHGLCLARAFVRQIESA